VNEEQEPEAPTEETPPEGETPESFDAEYVAKLRKEAAKYRTEAKANAEAAKKLAEIEDASKTEQERQAARLAELEDEAKRARSEALRFKIASKFGVSDEDADLFLTGTDEETLTKQAERLALRNEEAGKPRAPRPDPNQGRQSGGSASTADQFAAAVGGLL
jgi:hypothetical protein